MSPSWTVSFFFSCPKSLFFVLLCVLFVFLPDRPPVHAEVPRLTDLSFGNVTDTSISLHWSPLSTPVVTGYRIMVAASGESIPIFEDMVNPATGNYTVYGLEPGIDYDISVTTVTESGESEPVIFTQQTSKISLPNREKIIVE